MQKRGNIFLLVMLLFISASITNAQNTPVKRQSELGFIENKGQVHDQNYKPNTSVKYLLSSNRGLSVQLKKAGFSYDTYVIERKPIKGVDSRPETVKKMEGAKEEITYRFHRIDVELVGANPNAEMIAEEPSVDFVNFYTPGTPSEKGITGLHKYKKVTYKEIYPGIDLDFFVNQGGDKPVEYNFIVKDNGDINQIKLKYSGETGYQIGKDKITIQTAHGNLCELIPSSWIKETGKKQVVEYRAIDRKDNEFTVGLITNKTPIKGETLIVDPAPILEWATYYGGSLDESLRSLSINPLTDDVYCTGYTNSTTSLATSGVYQTALAGSYDAILVKFNQYGVPLWSTYFGGTSIDGAFGVAFDLLSGVSIVGKTKSVSGISTAGALETVCPGAGSDWATFLARFNNADGTRLWATYYGAVDNTDSGVLEDNPPAIAASPSAIYIISASYSDGAIVAGASPIQSVNNGYSDITIAKFALNGTIQWGTYFGTTDREQGTAICIDALENIYVSGNVKMGGLAMAGAHQSTLGGGFDGFLMKINSSGIKQWFTYYGGEEYDKGLGVTCDANNDVYVVGATFSLTNISSLGSFLDTKPGSAANCNGFIAKFNTNGVRQWGSYIGGSNYENALGITTTCGNDVVVSLESKSSGLSTANAYQSTIVGNSDALLIRFNPSGIRQWATYYGGTSREQPWNVKINSKLKVYVCGKTASTSNIATPDGYDTTFLERITMALSVSLVKQTLRGQKQSVKGLHFHLMLNFQQQQLLLPMLGVVPMALPEVLQHLMFRMFSWLILAFIH